MGDDSIDKVEVKSSGIGKTFSIIAKILSILFAIVSATTMMILKDTFSMENAGAIIIIASFIAGSALPIDISKIIENIKK